MNLVLDIGNTKAKMAVFQGDDLLEKLVTDVDQLLKYIKVFYQKFKLDYCIVSSVTYAAIPQLNALGFKKVITLDHTTHIPFKNNYGSPETLGVDRIALASAATVAYAGQNVLVIDAGTCITYDFLTKDNEYLGGAISPGINMRYKSLHTFTAKLPLLQKNDFNLIGTNTVEAIHSGVMNGVLNEIDATINQYRSNYQTLTVVLTGGDTNFLAKKLKNTIFANPNFLLVGLNRILTYNIDE